MLLDNYVALRRRLILGNQDDYPPARLRALANDLAAFEAEFSRWGRRHATILEQIADDIDSVLMSLAHGAEPSGLYRVISDTVNLRRRQMPRYARLLDVTPALYDPFRNPMPSSDEFIATLRVIWIAVERHELLTEMFASSLPKQTVADTTPEHLLWLTREWIAKNVTGLLQLGRFALAVDEAMDERSMGAARNLAAMEVPRLTPTTLTLINQAPGLRRLVDVPDTDDEFRRVIQRFVHALPY